VKRSTEEPDDVTEDAPIKKKGRAKIMYGVIQQKWYISSMPKNGLEVLKMAGKILDVTAREEILGRIEKLLCTS